MVLVNSAGALAVPWQHDLSALLRACLVVAIAALGMKTSFPQLAQAGWQPMLLIAVETAWMAGLGARRGGLSQLIASYTLVVSAGVAQLVEQRIRNAKVTSSIPVTGTKKTN